MSFDHIRALQNFSAKVFREAAITGETRRQVSDRLENEALQVPGFQFTDIAGRRSASSGTTPSTINGVLRSQGQKRESEDPLQWIVSTDFPVTIVFQHGLAPI